MLYLENIILGDMNLPLSIFLSMRKWEMLKLNIIWGKCIMKVNALVVPETMTKLRNGIGNQLNKEMLKLNVIWAICTEMV